MSKQPPGSNARFSLEVPAGESRPRLVCQTCGFIDYGNPRVVVGAVCRWRDRLLLCRRSIPPRRGFWTLPSGFLEDNETTGEGAAREALEEARAEITIRALLAVYDLPHINLVHLVYLADLGSAHVAAGEETLEARLFGWDEIPWSDLAFPTVRWALRHGHEVRRRRIFTPFTNPPGETSELPPAGPKN